jgi:hypothetical protein
MNCGRLAGQFVRHYCLGPARDVSGQVFGTRMNEIDLFSSPRPIRHLHSAVGWTWEAIAEHALPALKPSFMPIDRSGDAFFLDLL